RELSAKGFDECVRVAPDFDETQPLGGRGDEHGAERRLDGGPVDGCPRATASVSRRLHAGKSDRVIHARRRSVTGVEGRVGHGAPVAKTVEESPTPARGDVLVRGKIQQGSKGTLNLHHARAAGPGQPRARPARVGAARDGRARAPYA